VLLLRLLLLPLFFFVRPPLAAAYVSASAGCPLARRARVTSVPDHSTFAL